MPQTEPKPELDLGGDDFVASPWVSSCGDVAEGWAENARLREENYALLKEVLRERQQAHYYQRQHSRACERLNEMQEQISALKAKVAELMQRLFGRKSERSGAKSGDMLESGARRPRGQQRGAAGHGRKRREELPVIEIEIDPPAAETFCARCGKAWEPLGEPEVSERIEWDVRLFRRRTIRKKYRRPKGCTCEDGRPRIVCAPAPVSLIAKGLLGVSFIVEVLLLKFLYSTPLHRIIAMARSAGMALSAGTLCGTLEKIAPLFAPLYDAIYERSRREQLALMDETRWEVFTEEEGKLSHRWWLWVVVTAVTKLYILSPSRSGAVPKEYFGYDAQQGSVAWHRQVMVDRYKAYEFLSDLLLLAYCWVHVRRDFMEARSDKADLKWADGWIARIGALFGLNKERLALARVQEPASEQPAPFVQLDAQRMKMPAYREADQRLRQALKEMAATRQSELAAKDLRTPRRKILQSMEVHWHGLTLFAEHPQIPMDNNGAERAVRPAAIGRKNYYGSGSKWSGQLLAWLMSLLQTLLLHKVDPRVYLNAYLQACAHNGSQAPADLTEWLPWNFAAAHGRSASQGTVESRQEITQSQARAP